MAGVQDTIFVNIRKRGKMTTLSLVLSAIMAWTPMTDGQRHLWDEQGLIWADVPYTLGVSCIPDEIVSIEIVWGETILELDNITGTHSNLLFIDDYCPVEFYESGQYIGSIVPEPSMLMLLLAGMLAGKVKK